MDANELKQYIIDNNLIQQIIKDLNCQGFKEYKKEYRCGLPSHSSSNNIAINKETLSVKIFKPDEEIIRGDIFTLIMDIKNISFSKANKYLYKLLGLEYNYKNNKKEKDKDKIDPLHIFKKIKRKKYIINKDDIDICDESIIKEYIPLPHINWVKEGILPFTCEKFKIGYSDARKRIIIPERYWCGDENEYIGIMGRTVIKHYDMLDIPKYFPLKPFPKSINLYGLQENYNSIQKSGIVVVAESQKSVLKRHSRKDETVVSIGSHDISDEQVKILIGLNVEIVIAMDVGININHIRKMCECFYKIRKISYIFDKYNLLNDKDSPMDSHDKIYKYLLKHRILYDENEHLKYLKGD